MSVRPLVIPQGRKTDKLEFILIPLCLQGYLGTICSIRCHAIPFLNGRLVRRGRILENAFVNHSLVQRLRLSQPV